MTLAKAVEAATKRSNYPWSDGGQYTAQDYKNEGAIELANHLLASLPDDVTVSREVLQGVREAMQMAETTYKSMWNDLNRRLPFTAIEWRHNLLVADFKQALASLDAVLEGK